MRESYLALSELLLIAPLVIQFRQVPQIRLQAELIVEFLIALHCPLPCLSRLVELALSTLDDADALQSLNLIDRDTRGLGQLLSSSIIDERFIKSLLHEQCVA